MAVNNITFRLHYFSSTKLVDRQTENYHGTVLTVLTVLCYSNPERNFYYDTVR